MGINDKNKLTGGGEKMKKKLLAGLATGLLLFGMVGTASATLVNLSITGSWSASDFATGNLPDSDGNVFGLAPYDGSLTVDLLVNTDSFMHYAAGIVMTI